jgi:uncharacterized YigZ family protein
MDILLEYASTELHIKNSRFIAEVFPVTTQAEARDLLKEQKNKYKDASHVVHAFIVGKAGEVMGMSDDGEPAGTAGRPVLDVLKGKHCTNILLTITRYFGGTLLGTGGLVKAYGDSAKQVLVLAKVEPLVEKKEFSFHVSYEQYDMIKRYLNTQSVSKLIEEFSSDISVKGLVVASDSETMAKTIFDMSKGQVIVQY